MKALSIPIIGANTRWENTHADRDIVENVDYTGRFEMSQFTLAAETLDVDSSHPGPMFERTNFLRRRKTLRYLFTEGLVCGEQFMRGFFGYLLLFLGGVVLEALERVFRRLWGGSAERKRDGSRAGNAPRGRGSLGRRSSLGLLSVLRCGVHSRRGCLNHTAL